MKKSLLVLFILAGLAVPRQAHANITLYLNYTNSVPPFGTQCLIGGSGQITINATWMFQDGSGEVDHANELPEFGYFWHCLNNYSGSMFFDTGLCKCLETIRAADSVQVPDFPPYKIITPPPDFPITYSGLGCF